MRRYSFGLVSYGGSKHSLSPSSILGENKLGPTLLIARGREHEARALLHFGGGHAVRNLFGQSFLSKIFAYLNLPDSSYVVT